MHRLAKASSGRVAKPAIGRVEPIITQLSRFVNLLKSEEAPEQIVLIVDGPLAGKSEAFAQPQHRFEPGDLPPSRPSIITRVRGFDTGWSRVGQALGALLPGFGWPARNAA